MYSSQMLSPWVAGKYDIGIRFARKMAIDCEESDICAEKYWECRQASAWVIPTACIHWNGWNIETTYNDEAPYALEVKRSILPFVLTVVGPESVPKLLQRQYVHAKKPKLGAEVRRDRLEKAGLTGSTLIYRWGKAETKAKQIDRLNVCLR
jgi:hypothetical protein